MKKTIKFRFLVLTAILAALAIWPYWLIATPNSRIQVVDERGEPLIGVLVIRYWSTSEGDRGSNRTLTDAKGAASFPCEAIRMSLLKRVTRPLFAFVPAICGSGAEVYGLSTFRVQQPEGYVPELGNPMWKRVNESWQTPDGVCVHDPSAGESKTEERWVELYIFNKRQDFDFTLRFTPEQK